jgi:hypothetical protein
MGLFLYDEENEGTKMPVDGIPYTYSYTPTKPGVYTAYVSAYTHEGSVDSDWITFHVGRYTISYDANGGSGAPGSQTKYYGKDIQLSDTEPTRDNYIFQGWATSTETIIPDYLPSAVITQNEDMELYAVWVHACIFAHKYETKVIEPTCTESGYSTHTCTVCGDSYVSDYTDAKGHSISYEVAKAPTVTETGELKGDCAACTHTESVSLPKLNTSDYTYSVEKEPSYTTTGIGRYTWKNTEYGLIFFDVTLEKLEEEVDPNAPQIVVSNETGMAGQQVEVTISVANNPGVASMMLSVGYDREILTLVGVSDHGTMGTAMHSDNYTACPYTLTWANDLATENYTYNGEIVTLTFAVAEDAEVTKTDVTVYYDYDNYDIFNAEGEAVKFAMVDGSVNVIDVLIGDVNSDGKVNTQDRMILTRYLAKWSGYSEEDINMAAADVNCDGKVNTQDRMILTRYLAKWTGYENLPHGR